VTLARRLLVAARGGGGFVPPTQPFTASGAYTPNLEPTAAILTQVHCHTTASDGSYSPSSVVASYLAAGYGALVLTDHDKVTAQPAGIDIPISGNELSGSIQHIIATNSTYTRGAVTNAQTIVDAINTGGGQAHIAHPLWSVGMTYAEMAALTGYAGLEIHNMHCISGSGQNPISFPGYAVSRWDALLTDSRRDLWGFAVDDLHSVGNYTAYDVGRLRVFVEEETVPEIMSSMALGCFVADVSNYGVTPGYPVRTSADLSVSCPGATRIEAWGTGGTLLDSVTDDEMSYEYVGGEHYVRLVAIGDYVEPFDSALSDRWRVIDGTWTVSGGSLNVTSDGTARRVILRRHVAGDFTMEADVEVSDGGLDAIGLLFHVLDSSRYYMLRIGASTVTGYNNELAVAKTTNNALANNSQLDNATFDPAPETVYTMKMAYTHATGRIRAKVWETGESEPDWMLDVNDTTWKHGAFGIRANRSCKVHRLTIDGFQTFYQPVSVD
jgi:hypothetical protein